MRTPVTAAVALIIAIAAPAPSLLAQAKQDSPPVADKTCPIPRPSFAKSPVPQREATTAERQSAVEFLKRSPTGAKAADYMTVSYEDAARLRKNTTRMSYDPGHGTQVTFNAADGRIFLWYPGNKVILPGRWMACEDYFGYGIGGQPLKLSYGKWCFSYPGSSGNPITGHKGGGWECGPAGSAQKLLVEVRQGDVFGLATKVAPPFELPKDRTTFDALLAKAKGQPKEPAPAPKQ